MRIARPGITAAAGAGALLAGCALGPDRMEILVATTPPGASCLLERQGQAIATVAATPAIALVDASEAEITVRCRRSGFADAALTLHPQPQSTVFGPLLAPAAGPYEQRVDIALVPR
jgi:hypothetical protein